MTYPPLPEPYTLAQRAASKLARTLPGDDLTPIIEALQEYIAPVLAERDALQYQLQLYRAERGSKDTQLDLENAALREQVRVLREALADSIDSIEGWGAYASEYFQGKHKLRDELAQRRAALEATKDAT